MNNESPTIRNRFTIKHTNYNIGKHCMQLLFPNGNVCIYDKTSNMDPSVIVKHVI